MMQKRHMRPTLEVLQTAAASFSFYLPFQHRFINCVHLEHRFVVVDSLIRAKIGVWSKSLTLILEGPKATFSVF